LLIFLASLDAIAAWQLVLARSADNTWSSVFDQADLFGVPAIARAVAVFGIATAVGAVVGRILPSVLVTIALAVGLSVMVIAVQPAIVQPTHSLGYVGPAGSGAAFLRENPDADVIFVTSDNRVVLPADAPMLAPAGEANPLEWLADHSRVVPLGVSQAATARWQAASALMLTIVAAGTLGVAAIVVRYRTPR
jgi:hypothetical protein